MKTTRTQNLLAVLSDVLAITSTQIVQAQHRLRVTRKKNRR